MKTNQRSWWGLWDFYTHRWRMNFPEGMGPRLFRTRQEARDFRQITSGAHSTLIKRVVLKVLEGKT